MALKDAQQCDAINKRNGRKCQNPAVKGNTKCRIHGGKSLIGITSPSLKTGRYSKYIPAQLSQHYQDALSDPDLLSLNQDVALMRSFVGKYLNEIDKGDSSPAWIAAQKALTKLKLEQYGTDKYLTALLELSAVIEPNYRAAIAEQQVTGYINQLSGLADKERRLLIDRQQVITVERMMLMITAIAGVVKQHVNDRSILNAIQNDIQGLITTGV